MTGTPHQQHITMEHLMKKLLLVFFLAVTTSAAQWGAPSAPAIPEADGYVHIPNVAVAPQKSHIYRAIFNATAASNDPSQLIPAINMAGSELNAFAVSGIPHQNVQFVIVFHGVAMNGILKEDHYKSKFGVSNPNISALTKMKQMGVKLFVCGQNLAAENIDPTTITPDVTVASDALIVLMEYQNKGYALMSF
jgi:intracellular sulfur oxidation DsrE/DsrF family protein